jgi:hypothetical protein
MSIQMLKLDFRNFVRRLRGLPPVYNVGLIDALSCSDCTISDELVYKWRASATDHRPAKGNDS